VPQENPSTSTRPFLSANMSSSPAQNKPNVSNLGYKSFDQQLSEIIARVAKEREASQSIIPTSPVPKATVCFM